MLLYLRKYIANYGKYAIFFGYQRQPYIQGSIWEPSHGQILQCERESNNTFAASIMNDGEIVGHWHVP